MSVNIPPAVWNERLRNAAEILGCSVRELADSWERVQQSSEGWKYCPYCGVFLGTFDRGSHYCGQQSSEGVKLYVSRCGWCGAYEDKVSASDRCQGAISSNVGDRHQFTFVPWEQSSEGVVVDEQREADIRTVAWFVVGWWPGLEDGIDCWGDEEALDSHRAIVAARRLIGPIPKPVGCVYRDNFRGNSATTVDAGRSVIGPIEEGE